MKTLNIDAKSLMIGILLGICVLLLVGASPQKGTNGRYQLHHPVQATDHTFLLDTTTGKLWRVGKNEINSVKDPEATPTSVD